MLQLHRFGVRVLESVHAIDVSSSVHMIVFVRVINSCAMHRSCCSNGCCCFSWNVEVDVVLFFVVDIEGLIEVVALLLLLLVQWLLRLQLLFEVIAVDGMRLLLLGGVRWDELAHRFAETHCLRWEKLREIGLSTPTPRTEEFLNAHYVVHVQQIVLAQPVAESILNRVRTCRRRRCRTRWDTTAPTSYLLCEMLNLRMLLLLDIVWMRQLRLLLLGMVVGRSILITRFALLCRCVLRRDAQLRVGSRLQCGCGGSSWLLLLLLP